MTVNTNGNAVHTPMNPQMDHTNCCGVCADRINRILDSQLRTETMVKNFMEAIQNNPMLRAMGAKFGM